MKITLENFAQVYPKLDLGNIGQYSLDRHKISETYNLFNSVKFDVNRLRQYTGAENAVRSGIDLINAGIDAGTIKIIKKR